jgi:hypothetical protein
MNTRMTQLAAYTVPLFLAGFLACSSGHVGDSGGNPVGGSSSGGSSGGTSSGGDGGQVVIVGPDGSTITVAACNSAAPLHARLLLSSQYDNTILDFLKIGGNPSKTYNFGASGYTTQLDDIGAEYRGKAAAGIATQAAASLAMWSPCAPPTDTTPACEQTLIDWVGLHAYRHPVSMVEHMQMQTLFDAGVKEKDFATGVEWLLTGVLQSPDFLYQLAKPAPTEQAGQMVLNGAYEMASRLSYFVWDSMPDDMLFQAAASSNALRDGQSVQAQVARMMSDQARLVRGVTGFYAPWLELATFSDSLAKADKLFTADVVHSLGTSLLMSATQLYMGPTPNISGLFSGQTYYMNQTLQTYYHLTGAAAAFIATDMPNEFRSGLLTHPAFLAMKGRAQKTHPILRGTFVRSKLLCQDLTPPPGLVFTPLPEVPKTGVTTRQEIISHVPPQCAACHDLIDPPGFSLENYDEVGRYRTMENGVTVDSSGNMTMAGDLNGAFAKGSELMTRIAASNDVKTCFAQQYFEHALSGDTVAKVAPDDQCSADGIKTNFAASGDLNNLIVLIATSDSFRMRKSEGAAP